MEIVESMIQNSEEGYAKKIFNKIRMKLIKKEGGIPKMKGNPKCVRR